MDKEKILDLFIEGDLGKKTIREYLKELLWAIWDEGEGFSGKRPFGNSGWEHQFYVPLARAGLIEANIDKDDYVISCDREHGKEIVYLLINHIFKG